MNGEGTASREELLAEIERLRSLLDGIEFIHALGGREADPYLGGLLKLLFDAAPFPMTVTDPATGELIFANRTTYSFYQVSRDEAQAYLNAKDYYVDLRDREAIVRLLMERGAVTDFVIPMKLRSGEVRWMSFNARVIKFGSRTTILSAQFDVTARVLSERKLAESEEKFHKAFMNAPVLMAISEIESRKLLDVNLEFEKVSGYSREELIGRTTVELGLVRAEDRRPLAQTDEGGGRTEGYEFNLRARDGRVRQMIHNGELVTINGVRRKLTIAQDVTEIRMAELEAIKAQRLEALGVLAGGIAHDFNNLLTGILGNISLCTELVDPESEAHHRLLQCEKACRRAGELSHQLLTFSRGGEPKLGPIDLHPFLSEAATFSLRGSNVGSEVVVEPDLHLVEADEGQLGQVMNNLLINSAQAMPNGGIVRIIARNVDLAAGNEQKLPPGRYIQVEVKDAGCGIPAGNIERVFDPYFTTKAQGTGLGLSTVYSIIKRHHGAVWVGSREGEGATFSFLLPAVAGAEERGRAGAVRENTGRGGKILVMDDEPMILEVAKAILRHLGYTSSTALDGAEAVARAREAHREGAPFDLAVLDLTVPGGMGGVEAARFLADMSPSTLLIVSSGYYNDPVIARYREYGFVGAIPKPYAVDKVAAELDRVLGLTIG